MSEYIQSALMDSTNPSRSYISEPAPTVVVPVEQYVAPTFALTVSPSSVQEGGEFIVRATTTSLSNSTRLFVTVGGTGSAVSDDFNQDHWVMVINNNKGVVRISPKIDSIVENGETVQFQLRTERATGTVVATATLASITDIPTPAQPPALPPRPAPAPFPTVPPAPAGPTKTYSISIRPNTIIEGAFNYVDVYTNNVEDGTNLYITVGGSGNATANDFIGYPLTTTVANNNASRTVFAILDGIVETETVQLELRTGSPTGPIVAVSSAISVLDTAGGGGGEPPDNSTYFALASPTTVDEGNSVTITITTSQVADGTVLYVTQSGATNDSDFSGSPWTTTVTNNQATLVVPVLSDSTTEGNEITQFQIRTGSIAGPIRATTPSITIRDPGSNQATYSMSASPVIVGEGDAITVTVTTTNVSNGSVLFVGLDSGSSAGYSDFVGAPWAMTVSNNSASRTITVADDGTIESDEAFQFNLRHGSTLGPVVAVANTVTISNSLSVDSYAITASGTTLDEGQTITLNVTTTSIPDGTVLYISAVGGSGTADNNDFSVLPASVTINGNAASTTVTIRNDLFTEGNESAQFTLRTGSASGTIVATSNTISINDTSVTPPTGSVLSAGTGASSYPEGTTAYAFFSLVPALGSVGSASASVTPSNGASAADITGNLYVAYSSGSGYSADAQVTGGVISVPSGTTSIRLSTNLATDALTETSESLVFTVQPSAVIPFSATTAVNVTIGITDQAGGGGGASTISVIAGSSVVEGNYAIATYLVSPATSAAATVVATVAGDSGATEADITRPLEIQFSSNGGASYGVYATVPGNGVVTVPSNTNRIRMRVMTVSDGITETNETARFVLAQSAEGVFTNSWYVDQAIGITDTGGGGGGGGSGTATITQFNSQDQTVSYTSNAEVGFYLNSVTAGQIINVTTSYNGPVVSYSPIVPYEYCFYNSVSSTYGAWQTGTQGNITIPTNVSRILTRLGSNISGHFSYGYGNTESVSITVAPVGSGWADLNSRTNTVFLTGSPRVGSALGFIDFTASRGAGDATNGWDQVFTWKCQPGIHYESYRVILDGNTATFIDTTVSAGSIGGTNSITLSVADNVLIHGYYSNNYEILIHAIASGGHEITNYTLSGGQITWANTITA